jgi:hypothetical protein
VRGADRRRRVTLADRKQADARRIASSLPGS